MEGQRTRSSSPVAPRPPCPSDALGFLRLGVRKSKRHQPALGQGVPHEAEAGSGGERGMPAGVCLLLELWAGWSWTEEGIVRTRVPSRGRKLSLLACPSVGTSSGRAPHCGGRVVEAAKPRR